MKPTITDEVEQPEADRRMEICKSCNSYNPKLVMCSECHCFLIFKTKLKSSFGGKCPLGKW